MLETGCALLDTGLTSSCEAGFSLSETGVNGLTKPVSMKTGFSETGFMTATVTNLFGFRYVSRLRFGLRSLCLGLRFAVFGLGDSHYREFNYTARKLHARLKGLGADPFFELRLGDWAGHRSTTSGIS